MFKKIKGKCGMITALEIKMRGHRRKIHNTTLDCMVHEHSLSAWERMTLPHPIDGRLGHVTCSAQEMFLGSGCATPE